MATFHDDVADEVKKILNWDYQLVPYDKVPTRDDLPLGGKAATFSTAVLYIDIRGSSRYPVVHHRRTVARLFNAFHTGCVRIIRHNGGQVRSFNGDSILVLFEPGSSTPANQAVRCGLQLVHFVRAVLRPAIKAKDYREPINCGVGVTHGEVLAARIGLRQEPNNDLIFPCTTINLAAKMGDSIGDPTNLAISAETMHLLDEDNRYRHEEYTHWFFGDRRVRKIPRWTEDDSFVFAGKRLSIFKTDHDLAL